MTTFAKTIEVNGGNSGHGDNTGQRLFLQRLGRRRHLSRTGGEASSPPHASSLPAEVSAADESLKNRRRLLSGVDPSLA